MKGLGIALILVSSFEYAAFAAESPIHQSSASASYTAEAIREDLEELMAFVRSTHPDLAYSADLDEVV